MNGPRPDQIVVVGFAGVFAVCIASTFLMKIKASADRATGTNAGRVESVGGPPRAHPYWFRRMDWNVDGRVSRQEFWGADREFAGIDSNHDGAISPSEACAACRWSPPPAPAWYPR
ncbi:hypothetical protein J0H58_06945 [bacterium]|nr:hypothetical protein [bacterium]